MDDLRISLCVALKTAPKTLKRRYASPRTPIESDAATEELTERVLKILERYSIEPKEKPPPAWPRAG